MVVLIMVITLTTCYLKSSSSFSSIHDRMSSKPPAASKTITTVPSRAERLYSPRKMAPLSSRGGPAKCLPRLQETARGDGARTRRVMVRCCSEGSSHGSGVSTVVELPGINSVRRHSVSGTISTAETSNLEVFVSPLRRCNSFSETTHTASSSFRSRENPPLLRRRSTGTAAPIPPCSPRPPAIDPHEPNNNRTYTKTYGSSKHFELTLQKIEESKAHENGFQPGAAKRKQASRKNAIMSQYLGGEDFHDFRSCLEGRKYANISDMPTEYAEELLSLQDEDCIGPPEETEDEHLKQKCLSWLESLPQE